MLISIVRVFAFFALAILYILPLPFLVTRDVCHRILRALDFCFDELAYMVGWDPEGWPLPKSSDAPLPYSEEW
jgi:hypothetical protein